METKNKHHRKQHPGNIALAIAAAVILLTVLFYLINYLVGKNYYIETNDAQVESFINPVSARISGYIKQVNFDEHQPVVKGDTLVLIDDREYKEKFAEAQADVDDAKARIEVLAASIRSAESGTEVNKNDIEAAKARLYEQTRDFARYKNLVKDEAATGSDLDLAQSKYNVSLSEFNASKNMLKTNYAKINELKTQQKLLTANLEQKRAVLELAKINLVYTVIRAPYTGILGRKAILEGQQVQVGQPLVSIVNEKYKWVTANFKETQVDGMYPGQPVDIEVDAITNKVFHGQIEAIAASTGAKFSLLPPDNATGNFVKIIQRIPVKIKFTSTDIQGIKAGMNVFVKVKKKSK
ncbi:HlyD family secretion protein [Mucilaginibacter sp. SG564]|uniref:HlyD family secretion protein n=1 Tax=Mucilaginibacter sp. SG564 TaxID=2587022 RepID=UPI001554FF34|nr:HlyD family secretion protein [Mucilaginibacter sp. SG564]NOW95942.1 membrane fusion protein (multidrug efflux system) [Mucilaginibacter sp. SG564]